MSEPGVKCGEAELKSGEVRLEGVSCCSKKVERFQWSGIACR
jgi:hypothetical protein